MKAKLKILYEEGELDLSKPWTFHVELRKWSTLTDDYEDYVLAVSHTTDNDDSLFGFDVDYQMRPIDPASDGEAIRQAVKAFEGIAEEMDRRKRSEVTLDKNEK